MRGAYRAALLCSALAAVVGLGMWAMFDLTTGCITFAVACIAWLLAAQPKTSRRYRWGLPGAWLAYVGGGVVLVTGIPDRAHESIGVVILTSAVFELWGMRDGRLKPVSDRIRPVLYFMFGEPDPPPVQARSSEPPTPSAPRVTPAGP